MANISKDQIKIIHTLKPQIAGLSEREAYELFLTNTIGRAVGSSKDLNRAEAIKVTEAMLGLAGQRGRRSRPRPVKNPRMQALARRAHHRRPEVDQIVGQEDLALIQRAAGLRGWDQPTLDRFILRQTKHDKIRTKWDFERVFWPLKRMNDHDGIYCR